MVKPGSIIGGLIIAISIALQVITIVEITRYFWLLFIWTAGLIAGITYVLGGLAFETDKLEYFTIAGISLGAIFALTAYFASFQGEAIFNALTYLFQRPQEQVWYMVGWTYGAIAFSMVSAMLMAIAPLFIVAGSGKHLKGIKPGAILGGMLISGSLTLQVITVVHFAKYYPLLVFWFIGLIGAIALAVGAKAKWGMKSTEAFVTAGIFIGILLVLVIWWSFSPQMRGNIIAKAGDMVTHPFSGNMEAVLPTILSFASGVVAFFGVLLCAASEKSRRF
ncbi:MAG: hypothetical protein FK733_09805 [Asgard group archaeon]|nr:hypothetical protein [Asgard group archaeon]